MLIISLWAMGRGSRRRGSCEEVARTYHCAGLQASSGTNEFCRAQSPAAADERQVLNEPNSGLAEGAGGSPGKLGGMGGGEVHTGVNITYEGALMGGKRCEVDKEEQWRMRLDFMTMILS